MLEPASPQKPGYCLDYQECGADGLKQAFIHAGIVKVKHVIAVIIRNKE